MIIADDKAQQIRDALQLAGVYLKHVESAELSRLRREIGRACLALDAALNDEENLR